MNRKINQLTSLSLKSFDFSESVDNLSEVRLNIDNHIFPAKSATIFFTYRFFLYFFTENRDM